MVHNNPEVDVQPSLYFMWRMLYAIQSHSMLPAVCYLLLASNAIPHLVFVKCAKCCIYLTEGWSQVSCCTGVPSHTVLEHACGVIAGVSLALDDPRILIA